DDVQRKRLVIRGYHSVDDVLSKVFDRVGGRCQYQGQNGKHRKQRGRQRQHRKIRQDGGAVGTLIRTKLLNCTFQRISNGGGGQPGPRFPIPVIIEGLLLSGDGAFKSLLGHC